MRRRSAVLLALLWLVVAAAPAYAYLDPASGSMLIQLLLGGVAGAAVLFRLFWHKLRGLVGLSKPEDPEDEELSA